MAHIAVARAVVLAEVQRIAWTKAALSTEGDDVKVFAPDIGSQEAEAVGKAMVHGNFQAVKVRPAQIGFLLGLAEARVG